MQIGTITWHHVFYVMPERDEYVLIETRFCKYPACVGYHNGINWISCDDKTVIQNTIHWARINRPNNKHAIQKRK